MRRDSHLIDILKNKSLDGVINKYVNMNDENEAERFLNSLSGINLDNVNLLRYLLKKGNSSPDLSSLRPVPFSAAASYADLKNYIRTGTDIIKSGKVAFLIFSGGAATRLKEQYPELREICLKKFGIDTGDDSGIPKGLIPVTPSGYFTFIHLFAEQILRLQYEYRTIINLIVMVSSLTEHYIRRYFEENDYFGLMRRAVFFLRQQENPRLDPDGDMIFDGEKIITTGDGHGGVYRALLESHLREELIIRGVEAIVMFNVDNPLARFFDPVRIGYHFSSVSDFTSSVVEKTDPSEKIGVVSEDTSTSSYRVIEYNLLTPQMRNARSERGELLFSCGHINVNIASLSVAEKKFSPIVYRDKKIKVRGREILTSSLEWLNQDIVTVLEKGRVALIGLERSGFFLPTKNVRGTDSVETTIEGLNRYYKTILDDSCKFHRGSVLDLSPSFILDERDNHRLRNLVMEEDSLLFFRGCLDADGGFLLINRGLVLEKGAVLRIICENPFGIFDYDYISNSAKPDIKSASKIHISKPLRIRAGSRISVRIRKGGILIVNSGELSGEMNLTVESDQKTEI